jgi:signal transduction histidine kinase/ActR/RegA family two-component response regulator
MGRNWRNIRFSTRLLLIVLTCLVPVIVLGAWTDYSHWAERRAQFGDLALQQAQLLNGDISSITESGRTLLSAVAQLDDVRDATASCGDKLNAMIHGLPMFAFVVRMDESGAIRCSSASPPQSSGSVQPGWLHEALGVNKFTTGRFAAAPGIGGFLPLILPLASGTAANRGALVAGLELRKLADHLEQLRETGSSFLTGSVLTVADRDGVVLARSPQHASFVGKPFPPQAMALVNLAEPGVERLKSIDATYRVVGFVPVARTPMGLFVTVGFSEPAIMAQINRAALYGAALIAVVAIIAFVLTLFVARRFIGRPTRELVAAARRWREGDLSAQVRSEDQLSEFGQIAAAFNDMAATLARREEELREHADALEARVAERTQELLVSNNRLQVEVAERQNTEAALVQAQKLQAVGQLTGGIAHDFNNLLATIQGNLDLLARTVPAEQERQHRWIERATGAVHRGSQLSGRLLAFSRRQRLAVEPTDVNRLISDLVPLLRTSTQGRRIGIETRLGDDLWPAMIEPSQVEAAILNLALNARDAMPDGGVLTISTNNLLISGKRDIAAGHYVAVAVTDTGIGMDGNVARRAFEPFFTTKGPSGTGLGLSQVQGMVREVGGAVRLTSAPGEGTSITLLLPRATAMPKADRPPAEHRRARTDARVLVVDDDPDVLQVSAEMLRQLGYCVATAPGGREALEALALEPAIVVLDYAMPAMTGLQVAAAMRARGFDGPIVLATGYADLSEAEQRELAALQGMLNKPYSIRDLETLLAQVETGALQTAD